jgi:NAD(P)-dependent dehydrogenase (short-subunit alcohol dehydrogenase family)
VVNDLDASSVEAAVSDIRLAGGDAIPAVGDVSSSEAVRRILRTAMENFGGIDILYNNAAIGYSATHRMGIKMDDTVQCSEEDWARIVAINQTGVFLVCKYGIPHLIEQGGGVVINTASIGALRGATNAHAYAATKGAIVALTRSLARTYGASGVRANVICPGVIDTEMVQEFMLSTEKSKSRISQSTPVGRIGLPQDIANTALFLASDAASFISGQILVVDGGLTA